MTTVTEAQLFEWLGRLYAENRALADEVAALRSYIDKHAPDELVKDPGTGLVSG